MTAKAEAETHATPDAVPPVAAGGIDPRAMELLFSKAFHDLISPVSAVNLGVEMMQDTSSQEAFQLIASSAKQAENKLKYFRIAYGFAGRDSNLTPRVAREDAMNYYQHGKVHLEWPVSALTVLEDRPAGVFKTLFNVLLVGADALFKGGHLELSAPGPDQITIIASGAIKLREGLLEALSGDLSRLNVRTAHAWVTGVFLRNEGYVLEVSEEGDNRMQLILSLPPRPEPEPDPGAEGSAAGADGGLAAAS